MQELWFNHRPVYEVVHIPTWTRSLPLPVLYSSTHNARTLAQLSPCLCASRHPNYYPVATRCRFWLCRPTVGGRFTASPISHLTVASHTRSIRTKRWGCTW